MPPPWPVLCSASCAHRQVCALMRCRAHRDTAALALTLTPRRRQLDSRLQHALAVFHDMDHTEAGVVSYISFKRCGRRRARVTHGGTDTLAARQGAGAIGRGAVGARNTRAVRRTLQARRCGGAHSPAHAPPRALTVPLALAPAQALRYADFVHSVQHTPPDHWAAMQPQPSWPVPPAQTAVADVATLRSRVRARLPARPDAARRYLRHFLSKFDGDRDGTSVRARAPRRRGAHAATPTQASFARASYAACCLPLEWWLYPVWCVHPFVTRRTVAHACARRWGTFAPSPRTRAPARPRALR